MRKTTWIQWLALIVVASPGAFADEWNKSFTVSGKADVRVDVTDGEVTVRAWDRNEINARVSTVGWTIGSSEVRVIEHQVGDRVEIDVRTPRMNIGFGRHSVHVEVEVPRELRAEIHTGDGKISGHGLKPKRSNICAAPPPATPSPCSFLIAGSIHW